MAERDPSLRRIERDTIVVCGLMIGAALIIQGGRWDGAVGVLGGGALMALSYRAIKGGVDALVRRATGGDGESAPSPGARTVAVVGLRYALLAAGAYVILRPFGAHPLGLLSGVTAPVVAIALEAARLQWQKRV